MKTAGLTAVLAVLMFGVALAASPEERWKSEIAEANYAWAKAPHAILKIQDAAYLGEGQTATLLGTKAIPQSYHWEMGGKAKDIVTAHFAHGALKLTKNGEVLADPMARSIPIDRDIDLQAQPTQIGAGVMGVRIMVFNQKAKAAREFSGVDFYPYDPAYRVSARFLPDPKRAARVFRTSRGTDKMFFHAGDAVFTLKGEKFRLPFYADDPKKITAMSAFFTDALSNIETYGAGRYVDAEPFGPFPPKTVTIDFNFAYNPNCARSPFFTCPVAVDDIPLEIRAGERDPHKKHS